MTASACRHCSVGAMACASSRATHTCMRGERQKPIAQLILEAVHHRQDDDQRGDPDAHADDRRPGDEGDEELVGSRPDVAQSDEQRQGMEHRRDLTTSAAASRNPGRDRGASGAPQMRDLCHRFLHARRSSRQRRALTEFRRCYSDLWWWCAPAAQGCPDASRACAQRARRRESHALRVLAVLCASLAVTGSRRGGYRRGRRPGRREADVRSRRPSAAAPWRMSRSASAPPSRSTPPSPRPARPSAAHHALGLQRLLGVLRARPRHRYGGDLGLISNAAGRQGPASRPGSRTP